MFRFNKRVWITVLVLGLAACLSTRVAPHQVLSPSAEALRAAFNADTGKVRVVMLVSPT